MAEVPGNSVKLDGLYCITVFLNALSSDAFTYYTELQRVAQQEISLYPPTPTDLRGNIKCLSNSGRVIRGTITSSIPTVKRLFIDREEVEDILIDDYDAPFSEPNPSFMDDFFKEVQAKIEAHLKV